MDTENNPALSPDMIPANRQLIDELWSQKLISTEAKEFALEFIYPPRNWGLWTSRIFLVLGIALVLSGIIYFFAYNWDKITPMMKLISIQAGLAAVMIATYFYGLKTLPGKLLLVSAVALVGVFLAVFGQIYQTGANAYTLFMMWALLTLPWAIISEFAPLWLLWMIISNIGIILLGNQTTGLFENSGMMFFSYLILFNTVFLIVKEYAAQKGLVWLQKTWATVFLLVFMFCYAFIPTVTYIVSSKPASIAVAVGVILAFLLHVISYLVYRYRKPSIGALAVTLLSAATIAVVFLWKLLDVFYKDPELIKFAYLIMGCGTLGIFTVIVIFLRTIDKEIKRSVC